VQPSALRADQEGEETKKEEDENARKKRQQSLQIKAVEENPLFQTARFKRLSERRWQTRFIYRRGLGDRHFKTQLGGSE
jgi:hypothetical protein